eukprot:4127758-Heterocapsa_arctica.AAC.1
MIGSRGSRGCCARSCRYTKMASSSVGWRVSAAPDPARRPPGRKEAMLVHARGWGPTKTPWIPGCPG